MGMISEAHYADSARKMLKDHDIAEGTPLAAAIWFIHGEANGLAMARNFYQKKCSDLEGEVESLRLLLSKVETQHPSPFGMGSPVGTAELDADLDQLDRILGEPHQHPEETP